MIWCVDDDKTICDIEVYAAAGPGSGHPDQS